MTIDVWHEWNSVQSFKVRVVLAEKILDWTEHRIELLQFEHLQPDYLALNPNGVVPTLVHDGKVLIESSVICQYLDETFPTPALMPLEAYGRAQARIWLKFFDDVAHQSLRQISFEMLYRPLLASMSRDELERHISRHPNPVRAERYRAAAGGKTDIAAVDEAMHSIGAVISRLDRALDSSPWLAGADFSLADVGMSPFVERLDHLGLMDMLAPFPHASSWGRRLMARPAIERARAPLDYRMPVHSPER